MAVQALLSSAAAQWQYGVLALACTGIIYVLLSLRPKLLPGIPYPKELSPLFGLMPFLLKVTQHCRASVLHTQFLDFSLATLSFFLC